MPIEYIKAKYKTSWRPQNPKGSGFSILPYVSIVVQAELLARDKAREGFAIFGNDYSVEDCKEEY